MEININNNLFHIEIERKKIKNIYLRFNGVNKLLITCNKNISQEYIVNFIKSKTNWIIKNNKKLDIKINDGYQSIGKHIYLFGKKYLLKFLLADENVVFLKDEAAYFYLKKNDKKVFEQLLLEYAKNYYIKIIESYRIKNDLMLNDYGIYSYPEISFKKLKGRWGYCVPSRNKIVINISLIHYPIKCFEYVLLHEYVHLLIPNHSKAFYSIISKYMNDYKIYVDLLKK